MYILLLQSSINAGCKRVNLPIAALIICWSLAVSKRTEKYIHVRQGKKEGVREGGRQCMRWVEEDEVAIAEGSRKAF